MTIILFLAEIVLACSVFLLSGCASAVTTTTTPEIMSVSPEGGFIGSTTAVAITGRNFQQGATVTIEPSAGVAVENVNVLGATRITISALIAQDATQDRRNIIVTNPDGGRAILAGSFGAIGLGLVTIDTITPNSGARGGQVQVSITGTNFQNGAAVISGAGINITNVVVNSVNSLTATFNITDNATIGPQNIIVANPNGFGNSCVGCFSVNQ